MANYWNCQRRPRYLVNVADPSIVSFDFIRRKSNQLHSSLSYSYGPITPVAMAPTPREAAELKILTDAATAAEARLASDHDRKVAHENAMNAILLDQARLGPPPAPAVRRSSAEIYEGDEGKLTDAARLVIPRFITVNREHLISIYLP